jgi:lipid II:glycine glycyltransferase (peptidoglycan interpeptide bridge formation enzyme)
MVDQFYRAEIDAVTASEWSELLDRFADANLYQTWSYGVVRWGEKNLSHLVLRREAEVVAMAQVRIICPRLVKRGVAYVRWGPLCQLRGRELEPETLRQMANALHEEYVRKRRLFLRILPDAFAGSSRAELFRAAFSQFSQAASDLPELERTFLLDLSPTLADLRKKLDQKWRNQLNRAEKNGLVIVEGDGPEEYRVFAQLYEKMWSRKQFDTTVDVNEFARICADLPAGLKLKILICEHQGKPVSAIVCSAVGNTGIYLLGATHDEGLNTKGAYLLQWSMIRWLKENGFQFYDLGGIDPEKNPGVYHFKQGFSAQDVTRIAPLESCEDFISALGMKAMDFARSGLRSARSKCKNDGVAKPVAPAGHSGGVAAGKAD